ncbi:MAG: biopolymer transporter ExbD [Deltaproteobacteria bacterium]|nr:biopolymer transporter ExbD [Deltaproteobacteria bacterium]
MSFSQREARAIVRKAVGRVPEGEEIRHLNIMPLLDMMTILLVAVIAQAMATSVAESAATVSLPPVQTIDELTDVTTTLVITKNGIVVEGQPVAAITNGQVDCAAKEGGCLGVKITKLTQFLSSLHAAQLANARTKPGVDLEKLSEIMIIADRTTPYRLLVEVMFSAKQPEAGYKHFRMIVEKSFPPGPAQP